MPSANFHFPKGFLWGTATAAHQVEGNNTNNTWHAWEQIPGKIKNGDMSGLACDWWSGRWRDDLDRARETGQNAHRLSVEWSRIQPAPDRWNEDALDIYREMLRGLYQRGMTPLVTLHHFSDPLWLAERGGWENDETPARFEAFVRKVMDALKSYCTTWVPINEPNIYVYLGYLDGIFPPGKKDARSAFHVMGNMLRGHAQAYKAIKSIQREARVGTSINMRYFTPAHHWVPLEKTMASLMHSSFNASFLNALVDGRLKFLTSSARLPEVVSTQDFVGVNYYTGDLVALNPLNAREFFSHRSFPKDALLSTTGYLANWPEGLFETLKWVKNYNLPILITENGIEDSEDRLRPRYIVEHLHQLWRAIQFNWPIKGYFHWTLVDNFEWERGWTQRFGLWGLDVATQARIRRPSVDLYAAICQSNALTHEAITKYTPEITEKLLPG